MSICIKTKEQFIEFWTNIYNTSQKPNWSQILPIYAKNVHFRDSVQDIRGISTCKTMINRIETQFNDLKMILTNCPLKDKCLFDEK